MEVMEVLSTDSYKLRLSLGVGKIILQKPYPHIQLYVGAGFLHFFIVPEMLLFFWGGIKQ